MRKSSVSIICLTIISVILAGCNGSIDSEVNQVIQSQMQEEDGKNGKSDEVKETEEVVTSETTVDLQMETSDENITSERVANGDVDIDLTILSSTMVYSEVYNMMYTPQDYVGKTVRMTGMFVAFTNQDESQYYPAVIVADATACCSQGLEFILEGNPPYPEGYPETETNITVVGTFETYEEDGNLFCRLQNARIE